MHKDNIGSIVSQNIKMELISCNLCILELNSTECFLPLAAPLRAASGPFVDLNAMMFVFRIFPFLCEELMNFMALMLLSTHRLCIQNLNKQHHFSPLSLFFIGKETDNCSLSPCLFAPRNVIILTCNVKPCRVRDKRV